MLKLTGNYTRMPNSLLELITEGGLTLNELRVALVLVRQTYGFNKATDDVTVTRLGKAACIDRGSASRALHALVDRGLVDMRKGKFGYVVGFCSERKFDELRCADTVSEQHGKCDESTRQPWQSDTVERDAEPHTKHNLKTQSLKGGEPESNGDDFKGQFDYSPPANFQPDANTIAQLKMNGFPEPSADLVFKFVAHYEATPSRTPVKSWQAKFKTWAVRERAFQSSDTGRGVSGYQNPSVALSGFLYGQDASTATEHTGTSLIAFSRRKAEEIRQRASLASEPAY